MRCSEPGHCAVAAIHPLVDRVAELGSLESYVLKQDDLMSDCCARGSSQRRGGGLTESLMETPVGSRANKDEGLMPLSVPTYAQIRRYAI